VKGTLHSEEQIIAILKQGDAGLTTSRSKFTGGSLRRQGT